MVTKILGGLMMIVLIGTIVVILALITTIQINSPGITKPYHDNNGKLIPSSISEKGFFENDGVKLAYFIKGKNLNNPVLLYLHGGMPDYFLTQNYPTSLDEIFTVVWLEQRGAGASYKARFSDDKKIMDTLVLDVKEMTHYLQERFSQDKIYLMGHSGGSYLGIRVIERYPELYKAYIGVAQISYQKLSEKKAYDYIINQYKSNPKRKEVYEKLLANPVTVDAPIPMNYLKIRDSAMHELGVGTMRNMKDVVTGIFIPSLLFKEYTFKEKINLWKGKKNSGISILWSEMINHDLSLESTNFQIPIYFLHGEYDYTCSYELSKQYFDKIKAPKKQFFSYKNSAHSPIFEEPSECIKVIKENILN
jgi:pimeloyl-ACP methyl ester carboxylesterase